MQKLWDISPPVHTGSPVFPGDTPYSQQWCATIGPAPSTARETGPVGQQWQRPDLSMALPWLWRRLTDPTAGTLSTLPGGINCGTAP